MFLIENWGDRRGIPHIAKVLGRSENSIKIRASRLKLGPYLSGGELVSFNILYNVIHGNDADKSGQCYAYTLMRWEREGLRITKMRVLYNTFRVVDIEQFWKWAEKHRGVLDFSKFQENALGKEPGWVKEKRRIDKENAHYVYAKKCKWSQYEEQQLCFMCKSGTTWKELEGKFKRTSAAIRRKIYDLDLPHPISQRGFANGVAWNDDELRKLVGLINKGYSYEYCARMLNRSAQSVRGKVDFLRNKGQWSKYE